MVKRRQHCPVKGKSNTIKYYNPASKKYNSSGLNEMKYMNETKNAQDSVYRYTQFNTQDANDVRYSCALKKVRCAFQRGDNYRCKRMSTQTLPFCWQHTKIIYHLRPGRTELRGLDGIQFNFTGLFACDQKKGANDIVFCANEFICPYVSQPLTTEEQNNRVPQNEFLVYGMANKGKKFDGACVRGIGSMANTATLAKNNNAVISETAGYPSIKASKDIRNGQEILLHYGQPSAAYRRLPAHVSRTTDAKGRNQQLRYTCRLRN